MNCFLIAAITLVALTAAAQAEIMCTHNGGCWETGMRIYNNGAAYQWLPVIHQRDDGRPKKSANNQHTSAAINTLTRRRRGVFLQCCTKCGLSPGAQAGAVAARKQRRLAAMTSWR